MDMLAPYVADGEARKQEKQQQLDAELKAKQAKQAELESTKKAQVKAEISALVDRARKGDRSAAQGCSKYSYDDMNTCEKTTQEGLDAALLAKRIQAASCKEWALVNRISNDSPNPMRVSLSRSTAQGWFGGEVTSIDGKTLTIFDAGSRLNALVQVDATQAFRADRVAVGAIVYGIGVQAGSMPITLVSGAKSNAAMISAACIDSAR